jgi:outer membrane protein assembly factor BamB
MFGGSNQRNMVNLVEKGILDNWSIKKGAEKNIKWSIELGSKAYGGPVIAGGRIFVGTNNERPRDPKIRGDRGVLMCFRESDGKFLWQAVHEKLPGGQENDFPREGIASSPVVEGYRLYYVSNRCEVVCADVAGDVTTGKAKILWTYDMIDKQGVYPCQLANCSPLILGDLVYVITGNGVDAGTGRLPAPKAPSFLALEKKTGKLAWKSSLGSANTIRGQWSNPAAAEVGGKPQLIFPGGDGYLYGLEPKTGDVLWKFDCNPKKAKPYKAGGGGERCFIIATPVVHDNKVYVPVGQEPDDGQGVGHLWCVDLARATARGKINKDHDVSPDNDNFDPKAAVNKNSALAWHFGGMVVPKPMDDSREYHFGRTLSTVAIHDGLVYAAELGGYLYCVDAATGKKYWEFDFQESTWCSPYYVDGKVFVGTEGGELHIFQPGKTLQPPKKIAMGRSLKVPPLAANGVLYVNTGARLYAIAPAKKK